jgi:methanogenic corrinoid protein MtbC1
MQPLTLPAPDRSELGLSIAAVERETGLSKDLLRVWEKRYGFPEPLRDAGGDRLYPAEQVQRLRLISRLLGAGHRPGKVVGLDHAALLAQPAQVPSPQAKGRRKAPAGPAPAASPDLLQSLLETLAAHDPLALRHALTHAQLSMGLAEFITDLVAPLSAAVGQAWALGRFQIYEEHLFTEVMTGELRHAIAKLAPLAAPAGPKVLLTTLPQQLHGLGLLMVEALLALEGCTCVSLGTQTPLADVAQAAQAHRADVVALSFANVQSPATVLTSLRELRLQVPPATALWVGGSCDVLYQKPLEGIHAERSLLGLKPLVAQWRLAHPRTSTP